MVFFCLSQCTCAQCTRRLVWWAWFCKWFCPCSFSSSYLHQQWSQCLVKSLVVKRISRHCSSLNKKPSFAISSSIGFHWCFGVLMFESDLGDLRKRLSPNQFSAFSNHPTPKAFGDFPPLKYRGVDNREATDEASQAWPHRGSWGSLRMLQLQIPWYHGIIFNIKSEKEHWKIIFSSVSCDTPKVDKIWNTRLEKTTFSYWQSLETFSS